MLLIPGDDPLPLDLEHLSTVGVGLWVLDVTCESFILSMTIHSLLYHSIFIQRFSWKMVVLVSLDPSQVDLYITVATMIMTLKNNIRPWSKYL